MKKYIPLNKRSKSEQKKYNSQKRVTSNFNTGSRTMKDNKHPSRQTLKKELDKMIYE